MANESKQLAGNRTFYDKVIASDFTGDYSDIRVAFATEPTGTSFFVKSGNYTESTADVLMLENQRVHFDDVTITTVGYRGLYTDSTGGNTVTGKLTLTGTGETTERSLITVQGDNNNLKECKVVLVPTGAGLTEGSAGFAVSARIAGDYNKVNFFADTIVGAVTAGVYYLIQATGVSNIYLKATVLNMSNAASFNCRAVSLVSTTYSFLEIIIDNVTTDTDNKGTGISLASNCTDNTIIGLSKNCDLANLSDLGTDNNVVLFNVT